MPEQPPEPRHEARPSPEDEDAGRKRLASTLRHGSRAQVVVAVLLAIVGFAAVTQVRAYEVDDTYSAYSEQALIDVLNGLAGTSQRAQAELARLERARDELRSTTSQRQAALEQARQRADTLEILAGTVPVTGPGIRITITEETGPIDIDSLLDLVQEMRTAGAEAMQFNGQVRVIAQTSFEDGVGGILVDGTLLNPPYVVDVIGEPRTLIGGVYFADGPSQQLEDDGATVDTMEFQTIDIESVIEPTRSEYASPDGAQ